MKIKIFIASPRKKGNTELLVDSLIKGVKLEDKKVEIEKIFLNDMNIKLCQGLEKCRKTGKCPINDDCQVLFKKIKEAEVVVLASPNYWASYTAQLKIFLDRWGVFLTEDYQSRIEGKKMVLVAVCGNSNIEHAEYVIKDMKKAFSSLKLNIIGELKASANKKGAVLKNKKILKKAFALGKKLVKL
ncbi:MAG: flavodoxin family protein [Patescibacteria group bacterium]